LLLASRGLALDDQPPEDDLSRLPRKLRRIPEHQLFTPGRWLVHHLRRLAGRICRDR